MASRSSFWRFQPNTGGDGLQITTLEPTAGQVGAGTDPRPHAVTNEVGNFPEYTPEAAVQPYSHIKYVPSASRERVTSYRAFRLTPMPPEVLPDHAQLVGNTAAGHAMTGAPGLDSGDFDEHGPISDVALAPYMAAPRPESLQEKIRCWFKPKDYTKSRSERSLAGLGVADPESRAPTQSAAAIAANNAFQLPDPRHTFNTPAMPGMTVAKDGKYHVGKAGRPTEDELFDPMKVTIANDHYPVLNSSYPFLADRVRAGAAMPSEGRAASVPHWFTIRPFDQDIAHHLTGQKGVVSTPLAARPIQTGGERQVDMSLTGAKGGQRRSSAPGMTPAGPMPSTVRAVPSPWDASLFVSGYPTGAGSTARAKNWRL